MLLHYSSWPLTSVPLIPSYPTRMNVSLYEYPRETRRNSRAVYTIKKKKIKKETTARTRAYLPKNEISLSPVGSSMLWDGGWINSWGDARSTTVARLIDLKFEFECNPGRMTRHKRIYLRKFFDSVTTVSRLSLAFIASCEFSRASPKTFSQFAASVTLVREIHAARRSRVSSRVDYKIKERARARERGES